MVWSDTAHGGDEIAFLVGIYLFGAAVIFWISRKPLRQVGSHGYYRCFAWQGILGLFALHHPLFEPFAWSPWPGMAQVFMLSSIAVVIAGWLELWRKGQASDERNDQTLFPFERTTVLVETGIFRHIRHPMYASLALLAWGAYWQRPTWPGLGIASLTTLFLILTARADERECRAYFGDAYVSYQAKTWAFIPWVF